MKVKNQVKEKLYIFLLFILGINCSINAQTLNPSSISTNGSVNAIAQDSTSIYIGGNFTTAGYKAAGAAKINSNGKCLPIFPSIGGTIYNTISDNNGGWFVGGAFSYQGKVNLIHILADNTVDPSFTCNTNSAVRSLILEGTSLYIGGEFTQINSQSINYLALADATTGSIDLSWNPNPNNDVFTLLKDNNKLYIGGAFTNIANSGNRYFAIIDIASATFIPAISTKNNVNTINKDANNIYIGGSFNTENGFYTGTSAVISTTSDIPNHYFPKIDALTITSISDGNGGWYIGGTFTYQGKSNLIHVLPDNTIDNNFAPNPNNYPQSLFLDGNTLYVGGAFTQIGGQNISYLASINSITGVVNTNWNPNPNNNVTTLLKDNDKLYVGGTFTDIGNSGNKYFAIIDTNTAEVLQSISTEGVVQVINQDIENIYVGGSFGGVNGFYTGSSTLLSSSSDLPTNNFPKISGSTNVSIPDGNGGWYIGGSFIYQGKSNLLHVLPDNSVDTSFSPNPNGIVKALYLDGSTLYVGGLFTQIDSQNQNYLAAISILDGNLNIVWNPNPNSDINAIVKNGTSIYVSGNFTSIGGQTRNYLAEINDNNGIASNWNPNPSNSINCIKLNIDKLIVGGNFTNIGGQIRSRIAEIDLATGLATNWNPNANNIVYSIELNSGNKVFLGGNFTIIGGQTRNRIAEIDLTTGLATTWNPNANNIVRSINLIGNNVFAGGDFTTVGGQTRKYLVSISSIDGSINSWDPIPSGAVNTVNSFNNDIVIAGNFTHTKAVSRNNLLSISKSSNLITSWNPNPNSQVLDIEIAGTSMYVGGSFAGIGGQSRNNIGEINISTGLATTWNPNPNAQVHAIKVIDNVVYIGGSFTSIGGQTKNYLASVNSSDGLLTNWNPNPSGLVNSINTFNNDLTITGNFKYLKNEIRYGLLAISKTDNLISSWNPGLPPNQPVYTLEIDGSSLYVGGSFNTIGGQSRNNLAKIDVVTGLADGWNSNTNGVVNSIKLIGSSLYVGGNFTTISGQSRNYLAAINPSDGVVLPWNPKPNGTVNHIQQSNQDFIISGSFTFVNTEQRNNLLKISKADDLITDWNPSPNNIIQSIELNGLTGFFGGGFTSIGGQSRNRIAEINLNTGLATSWNPNSNNAVKTMKLNGSTLYVGGSFTNIGGQARSNLAALDTTTGLATPWTPNPNAIVNKLAVSNNILYVAGNYTTVTGQTRNRLASFTTSDGLLTTWNPDVSGNINDLFVTGSTIYIGGVFTQVSSQPRSYIASFVKNTGNLRNWKPILNGSVTSLISSGKYIYAGGTFTSSGGQSCSGFTMINVNTGFPKLYFPIVPTCCQITTMSANSNQLFLGGNFVTIDSKPFGGLATISFGDSYFTPTVDSITPNFGGIGGETTVSLLGNGFTDGTTIKFTKDGENDIIIPTESINIFDGTRLNANLDLHTPVATGLWNVVIQIPNENTITLNNSFEVLPEKPIDIQSTILGLDRIRPNTWQSYSIVVQNNSNHDVRGVPVYIIINADVEISFVNNFTMTDSQGNLVQTNVYSDFIPIDELNDGSTNLRAYPIIIGNITPFGSCTLNIKVRTATSTSFSIRVLNNLPLYGSPLKYLIGECFDAITSAAIGFIPFVGCYYGAISAVLDLVVDAAVKNDTSSIFADYARSATFAIIGCVPGGTAVALFRGNLFKQFLGLSGYVNNSIQIGQPCTETIVPSNLSVKQILGVTSIDPNDKEGPIGIGLENYININYKLPYIIRCENIETASAAAQTVSIVDSLDQSVFDFSSFELGNITIRDSIINVPRGLKHFETDIDLRPENNIIARILADFNPSTGIATWLIKSIDPLTLLETTDPIAGILPPNLNKPQGEASVMFLVKPLNNIVNDTQLNNEASIVFDSNPPIVTNQYMNTADIIKPVSQMNTTISNSNLTINLSWSGSDIGSGVRNYVIYYSKNGQPFEVLKSYVTGTTYSFDGELDQSYSFFTIATDNVGNVEDMKTMGEAQITLGVNQNELFNEISIYPNPNKGNFTIYVNSKENMQADLTITDIIGRVIFSKKQDFNLGDNYIPISLANDGIYILNVYENNNKVSKKIIVER